MELVKAFTKCCDCEWYELARKEYREILFPKYYNKEFAEDDPIAYPNKHKRFCAAPLKKKYCEKRIYLD